jgi:hypothetical protein
MVSATAPRNRCGFEIALICALSPETECIQEVFDKYWENGVKGTGNWAVIPDVFSA